MTVSISRAFRTRISTEKEKDVEFVGIDLHTDRFTCCYLDREGGKGMRTFELDEAGPGGSTRH